MENFKKILRIGTIKTYGGRGASVYIEVEYIDGRLSLHGVIGPLFSGGSLGGCGQICMEFEHENPDDNDYRYDHPIKPEEINFAKGWNRKLWLKLLTIWKKWHLNDMQAGCEHQRAMGWNKIKLDDSKPLSYDNMASWKRPEDHPKGVLTKPCPICGYKYGTAWLKVDVPSEVLNFLRNLLDADRKPAWI